MRIQRIAIIAVLLLMTFNSIATSDTITREQYKKKCIENLSIIGNAIKDYKIDHNKDIPNWLSDLYPRYLHDSKILLCPADKTDDLKRSLPDSRWICHPKLWSTL